MKLKIENIEFAYNGKNVLNKISTVIEEGDFIALVGPNGSGKSTFIKCLNRILTPQKGSIYLDGRDVNDISFRDLAKELAYVPQNEQKTMGLTVFDYILTGRKPYIHWKPSEKDIQQAAEVIKTLHLEDIAMKDINKLSGGQKQMICIARAITQEPRVLLLDEPTSNLDIRHQMEIMDILKKFSEKGISIIIAIHDINIALRYANKFIMLKNNLIFREGNKDIINKENIEELYHVKVNLFQDGDKTYVVPDGL